MHVEYLIVRRVCKLDLAKCVRECNQYKEMPLHLPADDRKRRGNPLEMSAENIINNKNSIIEMRQEWNGFQGTKWTDEVDARKN